MRIEVCIHVIWIYLLPLVCTPAAPASVWSSSAPVQINSSHSICHLSSLLLITSEQLLCLGCGSCPSPPPPLPFPVPKDRVPFVLSSPPLHHPCRTCSDLLSKRAHSLRIFICGWGVDPCNYQLLWLKTSSLLPLAGLPAPWSLTSHLGPSLCTSCPFEAKSCDWKCQLVFSKGSVNAGEYFNLELSYNHMLNLFL